MRSSLAQVGRRPPLPSADTDAVFCTSAACDPRECCTDQLESCTQRPLCGRATSERLSSAGAALVRESCSKLQNPLSAHIEEVMFLISENGDLETVPYQALQPWGA